MENAGRRSLFETDSLYQSKLEEWTQRRLEHLKKAEECVQQMTLYEQKLRHIQALVSGPQPTVASPALRAAVKRSGKRSRKSPIRDATLLVQAEGCRAGAARQGASRLRRRAVRVLGRMSGPQRRKEEPI